MEKVDPRHPMGDSNLKDAGEYDQLWEREWVDLQSLGPVNRHHRKQILELADEQPFASVLDAGCGAGHLLCEIHRRWPSVSLAGSDLSARGLAKTAEKVSAELFVCDLAQEAPQGLWDLVVCAQVVEHVREDRAVLRNLRRVTGKRAIVTSMSGRMRPSESHIGHVRNYQPGELEDKMTAAGYRVTRVHHWGFPFYSPVLRTLTEWLPGDVGMGEMGRWRRWMARALYHVYRLNVPNRGDVLSVVGEAC